MENKETIIIETLIIIKIIKENNPITAINTYHSIISI